MARAQAARMSERCDHGGVKVLVFRALQLGDMLCSVPALRALRAALPRAHVTLCGLPWAREFAAHCPDYVDDFIPFPGWPGLPEREVDVAQLPSFLAEMQRRRFDLVLQMHGNGTVTNALAFCFGGRTTAGFCPSLEACPDRGRFLPWPAREPEIWRQLSLMAHLGFEPQGDELEFSLTAADDAAATACLADHGVPPDAPFVCLHPGARAAWRRWNAASFAGVGDDLAARGWRIVITGVEDERGLAEMIAGTMRHHAANLAGRVPHLGALAALVARAGLLVCGDTGLSHLASAVATPSVVIFQRSELEGWPPLDRVRHRVVARHGGVRAAHVLAEALDLLPAVPCFPRRADVAA